MLEHAFQLPQALAAIVQIADTIRRWRGADDETTEQLIKNLHSIKSGALAFADSVPYLEAWKEAHHYSQTLVNSALQNVFNLLVDRPQGGSDTALVANNSRLIESDFQSANKGVLKELKSFKVGQHKLPDIDNSIVPYSADAWHREMARQASEAYKLFKADRPGDFMEAVERMLEEFDSLNGQADNRMRGWIADYAEDARKFGILLENVEL